MNRNWNRWLLLQASALVGVFTFWAIVETAAEETTAEPQPTAAEVVTKEEPKAKQPEKPAKPEQEKKEPLLVKLAEGKLVLPVPGEWKVMKPRNRLIQHEFSIAAAKGDKTPGRMTIMSAGGGVEANIGRWTGQFRSPGGKPLDEKGKKITKKKIGDLAVHLIELTGDFQDSPRGPFGPTVNRPGYRMLGAIIPLKKGGTWFVKFYGPKATIKAAEKDFAAMIDGLEYQP